MKISEIIADKYKLRLPPTVYYDLLADAQEAEEEQEPKTGHWIGVDATHDKCDRCGAIFEIVSSNGEVDYCPNCGAKMVDPQESEGKE